jgi:pullulanase/glycogen debranching enzyme
MGQEIGQSKFGKDNTYNLPDLYNRFSYRLLDERKDMYEYAKSLIAFRKKMPFFRVYDPRVIDRMLSVETIGKLFCSKVCGEEFAYPYKEVTFLYNSSDEPCYYSFAEDHLRLIDQSGEVSSSKIVERDVQVPSRTMVAYAIKGGK